MRSPKFLSLFSGVGGLDLGFVQAGFEPIGAFDICRTAVSVYKRNLCCDAHILDLSRNEVTPRNQPDAVIAGSPCQGFSTIGRRRVNDPRNSLFVRAAHLAAELDPQAIVLENVRGILVGQHRRFLEAAARVLEGSGYLVHQVELSAQDAGLPQQRKRVFLIATKSSRTFSIENASKRMDVNQAIEGAEEQSNHEPVILAGNSKDYEIASAILPGQKLCDVRGGSASVHSWDIPSAFGGTNQIQRLILTAVMRLRRRIRRRTWGDADPVLISQVSDHLGRSLDRDIRTLISKKYLVERGRYIDLARRFNGKFRRLRGDGISNAVDTRFGDPHYFLHPAQHRGLSAREAARIQGFPDSFQFSGSRSQQFRMIGNAVPVPLAKIVAKAVKELVRV